VVLLGLDDDPALRRQADLAGADAFLVKTAVDSHGLVRLVNELRPCLLQ
jgi:hypothetical protein